METEHSLARLRADLRALGVAPGDTVMAHTSYKSLGGVEGGAGGLFEAFCDLLGRDGTLLLPGFSYDTVTRTQPVFDRAASPTCVGFLPEYFRTQVPGVIRSLHATHSLCLHGARAEELAAEHEQDLTPVGPSSPLRKLTAIGGKILLLGCHADHITLLHGAEECVGTPYVIDYEHPVEYHLRDGAREIVQRAFRHRFRTETVFYEQHYARVLPLLDGAEIRRGKVLSADCLLLDAAAVFRAGCEAIRRDPYFFVTAVPLP